VAESMEETYNKEYPSALPLLPPMVRGHGLPLLGRRTTVRARVAESRMEGC
jgi:hypothetical protein